jgi:hypothetical protein
VQSHIINVAKEAPMEDQGNTLYMILFFAIFIGIPLLSIALLFSDQIFKALDKPCKALDKQADEKGGYSKTWFGKMVIHPLTQIIIFLFTVIFVLAGAALFIILPIGGATLIGFAISFYYMFSRAKKSFMLDLRNIISETLEEQSAKDNAYKALSNFLKGTSHENN